MSDIFKIESITDFHKAMGYPKPAHPLISLVDLSEAELMSTSHHKVATSLYTISMKTKFAATPVLYGQRYFDFQEGVLLGMSPGQVFTIDGNIKKGDMEGWALYFHPDLIQGYPLQSSISKFGFFDYVTHEALHLSEKEKETLNQIVFKIQEESEQNMDDYSNDLLVSNIELLLNYIKRFYGRQFKTRKAVNSDLLSKFEGLLKEYVDSPELQEKGLPSVSYFSDELHLSSSYFSDLLKKETGLSAQDHLHNALIKKAKNKLLNSEESISQIAFELGFEHPPYFSRLFKKKTGLTPKEFRLNLN
ncbi:helix-turn-helix transcriptional regulator [bacterium SCSIO 12741]|nr:helix-turn-helix transcriptional regulator [bacterium SCSIO 12741]